MTLSIDIARAADIPALCDLLENLFAQEADFQPDRAKQATALAAIINDPAVGTILVARQDADEQVVGMVSLLWTISTAEGGRVALLEDMVVAPAARGGGIGSALLGAAIEHAEGTGATRITLLTDAMNDAAQRFYRRHGFGDSAMLVMRRGVGELSPPAARG